MCTTWILQNSGCCFYLDSSKRSNIVGKKAEPYALVFLGLTIWLSSVPCIINSWAQSGVLLTYVLIYTDCSEAVDS